MQPTKNIKISKAINRTKQKGRKTPSLARQLRALSQLKWYTGIGPLTAISSTVGFTDCTTPAIGTAFNQRVGTKIHLQTIRIRGSFLVADTTNVVRMLVFRWHVDNNSDVPSSSELFDSGSDVYSGVTRFAPNRFTILHDEMFALDAFHVIKKYDRTVSLQSLCTFSSGTAGIGHVYVSMISDSTAVPHPAAVWDYQICWKDEE